jgi:hypothetical protein
MERKKFKRTTGWQRCVFLSTEERKRFFKREEDAACEIVKSEE